MGRTLLLWPMPPLPSPRQAVTSRAKRMLLPGSGGAMWGDGELDSEFKPGFEPALPLKMGGICINKRDQ